MNLLFTVALLELFVGGGGRLLEIGPVTVRMLLFAACLLATAVFALRLPRRVDGIALAVGLVGLYLAVHLMALLQGAVAGVATDDMLTEFQQSLYWLAAPFIAVVLQHRPMVEHAARLIRLAGALLAFVYLGTIGGVSVGIVDFSTLYDALSESSEFAFRSEGFFFYKGFLYLGVGAIFFAASGTRGASVLTLVVLTAMALTLTRGFVLSTSFALVAMLVAQRRWRLLGLSLVVIAAAAMLVWIVLPLVDEGLDAQRELSNLQRVQDFDFIVEHMDVRTLLFGRGLGVPINERINIENTLLWALWRLGLGGIVFWALPLLLCFTYYARIRRRDANFRLAGAFAFGTLLVYSQTLSNPYLNNPIGLSFVLVALFSLRTLAQRSTESGVSWQRQSKRGRPRDDAHAPA